MIKTYAYLCNMKRCTNCTFPTCSHTTDLRYRMPTEGTEMRLLGCSNGVEYYMEFVKKNEDMIDIRFNGRDKESTMLVINFGAPFVTFMLLQSLLLNK